jgi:uncharacterized protein YbjQ (UPF0145 family)
MNGRRKITDVPSDYRGRAFTSDLDARGLWLLFDKNFEPLGMVIGSCAYSVGTFHPWVLEVKGAFHGEFRKWYGIARLVALARMQFQADEMGADGVIGIHSTVEYLHDRKWIEVILSGTAVRYVGKTPYTPPEPQDQDQEQERVIVSASLPSLPPTGK